ncbi:MAG: hypothetical protein WBO10_03005 [Pyrinomonadaceae bacterium]
MKLLSLTALLFIIALATSSVCAQKKRRPTTPKPSAVRSAEIGQSAVVIDETISVLRVTPSLFANSIQRMRRGRKVQILGVTEADGVKFYKVTAPPRNFGWVQADAVFGKFRRGDEERLAQLTQAIDGFEQIEVAIEFFNLYPNSKFCPAIQLLIGDVLEETAATLSKSAASRLRRKEMAASAAPLHSYYLNFVSLDRYRKLGVIFLFNPATKQFHYEGASWKEILAKHAESPEVVEAQKRLDALKEKMAKTSVK